MIVLLIIALAVAAVGWSGYAPGKSTTTTVTTTATSAASSQDLVAAAKAEGGTLVVYTTASQSLTNSRIANFEKHYPWANVTAEVLDPPTIYSKLVGETQSGKHIADIVGSAPDDFLTFESAGLIENYSAPNLALEGWPANLPSVISPFTQQVDGIMYNTQVVPPQDAPKTWTDLGNPFWKGKIATDTPVLLGGTGELYAGLYTLMGNGNATWVNLMKAIAADNPTNYARGSEAENAVVSGQQAIDIGVPRAAFETDLASGAPLAWTWLQPTFTHIGSMAIVKGAPHPNMAMLWMNYFESVVGQQENQSVRAVSLIPLVAESNSSLLPPGITLVPVNDIYIHPNFWKPLMVQYFGNVTG